MSFIYIYTNIHMTIYIIYKKLVLYFVAEICHKDNEIPYFVTPDYLKGSKS